MTVTLSQALTSVISVDYATADDSANSGSDYQSKTGTLTFNPGDTTQTIHITLTDSDIIEPDETFLVNLSNPQSGVYQPTLADSQAVVTIQDNDLGLLSIDDISVDENAATALVTVSLDHEASSAISVDYATADGSASSGSDYQSKSGTLTFNPGDTTQTIEITLVDSDLVEADETFLLNLSNLQAAGLDVSLPDTQAVVTIQDDDRARLSIQDLTLDEAAGTASLTVSLDRALLTSITVDFETLDGTALVDSDYSATSGTLTFNPGETTQTINLIILDDAVNEATESFFVKLTNLQANGSPVDLITDQAEITILDNDQVNLSINDVEVNEAAGTATLTVTLEEALSITFSVDYQTSDGTAVANSDYLTSSGTLTFNPGDVSKTIHVTIVDTDNVEPAETLQVQLANLQGSGTAVSLSDSLGEISILDDDQAAISIDDVSVDENAGTARLTVSLDQPVETAILVDYATADQTALDGTDYLNTSGTLTFNAGETTKTITVNLVDSDQVEADETLLMNLSQIQSEADIVFSDNQGVVTIQDDDQAALSVQDLMVNEAAGKAILTVSLDRPVDSTVTVDFSTIDQSATSPDDYLSQTGTLTFAPGTMHRTIEIDLVDGAPVELPETFDVQLSNLQTGGLNVILSDDQATVTIKDDDLGDYELKEKLHAEGTVHTLDFFGMDIAVDGDTLISGARGWDDIHPGDGGAFIYVRNDQGTPEYAGDDTWDYQATLLQPDADGISDYFGWSVGISGDTAVVGAFFGDGSADNMGAVYVYTRSNGIWTFQQKLTVADSVDNGQFGDTIAIEGDTIVVSNTAEDEYTGSAYVFSRENGVWSETAKLTADSPEVGARFGDSIDIENSMIVIGARYASAPYTKSGAAYIFTEQAGTWTLSQKLTDPVPTYSGLFGNSVSLEGNLLLIGAASTVGEAILFQRDPSSGTWNPIQTLTASDAAPSSYFGAVVEIHNQQIFISSAFDPTGADNSGAVYRFTQDNMTWVEQQKISSAGTESGDDFGRVTAVTDGAILISARLDDDVYFNTGSIYVYGLPQNPAITIDDISVTEENDGSQLITANVTRTATKPGDLIYGASIDFRTLDGTATVAGGDYESTTGTIMFVADPNASSQTQTISIRIYGDSLLESDETFGIELRNARGHAHIADSEATVTIENDDQALLSIDDITVDEDAGSAILTVSLDQPVDTAISVDYATADQSATASEDYTGTSGTLTFNPGVQTQTISVPILLTQDSEPDETFLVNLSNLQNQGQDIILADAQAVVTIIDLPSQSEFSIHAGKVVEGDNGVSYLKFEIRRSANFAGDLDFESTVDFSTFDGTAIAGEDYVSKSQTLTFSASATATSQVQIVDVQITGDQVKEASETVIGRLNNPTGGSVFPDDADSTQASGIITNDDTDYLFQEFLYADPAYANHTDDNAGRVVAIDGDVMVMGVLDNSANGRSVGTAYVYVRNQQGTPADQSDDTWEFETVLTPATPFDANQFGSSVAIDGDTIVVGADREGGGAIYVFTRNGADWKTEPPSVEKLTVEGLYSSAYLGCAVSIYENTIVAGARFDSAAAYNSGAAYIFEKTGADWSNPAVRMLTASDYHSYDNYGISVSIKGDLIVVGAAYAKIDGSQNGAAYVYTKNGSDWTSNAPSEAKIVASNGIASDLFGKSVSTNGTDVAIGAENTDPHGASSGSAYLYIRNGSDWSTVSPTELEFTGKDTSDHFGTSVSLTADRLVVGAFIADTTRPNTGAVYVYSKTGANWDLDNAAEQVLAISTDEIARLGEAVAISGTTVVAGAPDIDLDGVNSGGVFIFEETAPQTWIEASELTPDTSATAHNGGDRFGKVIASDENYLVIGAPGTDTAADPAGVVYVYARDDAGTPDDENDDIWVYQTTFAAPDPADTKIFGTSVDVQGDTILVSVLMNSGSSEVYLYEMNGSDWTTIAPTRTALFDSVSRHVSQSVAVAINGDTIVAGAHYTAGNQPYSGSAFVYTRNGSDWSTMAPSESVLFASDGVNGDFFGYAVDISGDQIIVGAIRDDNLGGSAYLYRKGATGWDTATETKLTSQDTQPTDYFGKVVAIEGDLVAVASPQFDTTGNNNGAVYLYDGSQGWENPDATRLTPQDDSNVSYYGSSLDLHDGTLVVGNAGGSSKTVYIYEHLSGEHIYEETALSLPSNSDLFGHGFGAAVALQGNNLAVTALFNEASAASRIYSFNRQTPVFSIENTSIVENDDGTQALEVTVTATGLIPGIYTSPSVDFTTHDGSATALDQDFQASTGTLYFDTNAPSATQTQTITIQINGDDKVEADEMFSVELSNPSMPAVLAQTTSQISLRDNDAANLSIDDLTVDENAGTASITVSLNHPVDTTVTIDYDTADQSALAGPDYTGTTGTLTFNPGETTQIVSIPISYSNQIELDKTFLVNLSGLQSGGRNVSLIDDQALVTIRNVNQGEFSIEDASVNEDAGTVTLTVALTGLPDTTVSVDFMTVDQTATATEDYTSISGTLNFAPGVHSQTIEIPIIDSNQVETDEIVLVKLSNIQAGGLNVIFGNDQAEVTIHDDDQTIVSINDQTVDENAGTATITVSLDHPVDTAVSIDYATADQSALAGSDYTSKTGTLTFNPGTTSQNIVIAITDTDQVELDETFLVNLSGLQAGGRDVSLTDNQAQITIHDNRQVTISIDDFSVDENAGTATLAVSLDHPVDTAVSIDYATADQSALAGSDYTSTTGTLTFNPGTTSQNIVIPVIDSDLIENNETFLVNLSGIQSAGHDVILTDGQAQVTIKDDEQAPAQINLRVVEQTTTTSANGEVATLPSGVGQVSEWATWWVELWIDAQNMTNQGVYSAALDLSYQTEFTTATEIQFGPAFTENLSGLIDDTAGSVTSLSGNTDTSHLGASQHLLFARIKFQSRGDDQVQLDLNGKSVGPYDLGLEISSPQVALEGNVPLDTTAGAFTGTDIWANPYDLNDDNHINFRDLILFVSVYNTRPSASDSDYAWFADLNQNDHVDFKDLIFLASNYNKGRENQISYPASFPDAWNHLLTVDPQSQPQEGAKSLQQSTAQKMLDNTVEEVRPQLSEVESQKLETVHIQVTDLEGDFLGRAAGNTIYIDSDAAGYGWFIDATPTTSEEFTESSDLTLIALPDSAAAGRIDLWTVIRHELGHLLGYDHEETGWMQDSLLPGVRKIPAWENEADQFFTDLTDDLSIFL
ncbi:Calx-beta domain protein [Gimesia panareensis]|uniref:Calx-beta domain protein n=1 Tax=Gimesia panareensis TaxID=2527978 RepID=A0A517Q7Z5_9PLAN|nr:Calx-beta domain protein [Gimesia panareensis]